jgi:uncharacterized membrane protein
MELPGLSLWTANGGRACNLSLATDFQTSYIAPPAVVCSSDAQRAADEAARQRQRADRAEKGAEPLQRRIRELTAQLESQSEEIRVVSGKTLSDA